jgi:diguanylate cyclase (GGDEF)-like protein
VLKRTLEFEGHEVKQIINITDVGHLVGDVTLREVARMIRETVRGVDMVGRYGGEEFVVLLPETSREGALEVSERVRSTIAKTHFKVYDEETRVTVSIGLACFPHDLDDPEVDEYDETIIAELLRHADEALYRAKEEGRNRVVAYERAQSKS